MPKRLKTTPMDIIKEILSHIVLLFVALIVLMPILYLVSAGFRTNQAIFGPFIDTNSWADSRIPVKSESKVNQTLLIKRLCYIIDGKSAEEIKKIEESKKSEKLSLLLMSSDELVKNFKDKANSWIKSKDKDREKIEFIEAFKKWESSIKIPLEKLIAEKELLQTQIESLKEDEKNRMIPFLNEKENQIAAYKEKLIKVGSQLFKNYEIGMTKYEPVYQYEIRTSFDNFICFFTGAVPNAKNAKFPYWKWLLNSIIIAGSVAITQVIVTALAGYALSRFRFAGKKAGLMVILTVQVFPGTMAMVALYLLLQYLGNIVPALGIDRKLGLILIYLGGGIPFNIWLVKGYFDTVPKALEESAMIDGATYWQAFTTIILPLVRPILAVTMVLSFVGMYNEFVLAMVVLTSQDNFTLPVGLRFFMNAQQDARFGVFAACSILGSLPIVVLWLSLQNQIISGLTGGAVKG